MSREATYEAGGGETALSPQAESILGNGAVGWADIAKFAQVDDYLCGEIVARKTVPVPGRVPANRAEQLLVRLEGARLDGVDVHETHLNLCCYLADLREIVERFDPQVGDWIAVQVVKATRRGTRGVQCRFRGGVERGAGMEEPNGTGEVADW